MNNTGTIAGRKLVQISANSINNTAGSLSGQTVALNAVQDINNIGGVIVADTNLLMQAGRDINVASTTQSSAGSNGAYSFSQSGIDRVASVYTRGPGTLVASAGNNITLTAAQLSSGGDAQVLAGNNLTLGTVGTSRSDNLFATNADNHLNTSSTQQAGTAIKGAGSLKLGAGNDINATAVDVQAGQALRVNAGGSVLIAAGQNTNNLEEAHKTTCGGFFGGSSVVTRETRNETSAQASTFGGVTNACTRQSASPKLFL